MRLAALAVSLVALASASPARAETAAGAAAEPVIYPKPKPPSRSWNYIADDHRLTWSSLSVIRYNPLGLQEMIDLAYEFKLFDSTNILLKDSYAGIAFTPILTPAFVNPGLSLRVQPLAIWRIDARVGAIQSFGNFNLIQSWASPETATFADSALKETGVRGDDGSPKQAYATTGTNVSIINEFRIGLLMDQANRPAIEARNRTWAMHHRMNLEPGDTVWYDQYFDLLMPKVGWSVSNDLDVMYRMNLAGTSTLRVGARYNWARAYHDDAPPGAAPIAGAVSTAEINEGTHRVGPLVAYTFYDEPGGRVNRPTIIGILNWHTQHPYRTGQDVSAALPYFVIGYAVSGDLLPASR